jgi:hypothetical protein
MKTYSAQSGYVYQYFYEGQRPLGSGSQMVTEYVFSVSADRARWRPVSVLLGGAAAAWQRRHGRELSSTERYALAKMALFQALDERPTPARMTAEVLLREADIEAIAAALDFG